MSKPLPKKVKQAMDALDAHDKKVKGFVEEAFANGKNGRDGIVYFRYLGECRWQVEFFNSEEGGIWDRGFPVGLAWVGACPPKWKRAKNTLGPHVNYIIVADDERRQGIATKLIKAIERRWPDIWLSDAISKGGEALIKKFPNRVFDTQTAK